MGKPDCVHLDQSWQIQVETTFSPDCFIRGPHYPGVIIRFKNSCEFDMQMQEEFSRSRTKHLSLYFRTIRLQTRRCATFCFAVELPRSIDHSKEIDALDLREENLLFESQKIESLRFTCALTESDQKAFTNALVKSAMQWVVVMHYHDFALILIVDYDTGKVISHFVGEIRDPADEEMSPVFL